MYLSTRWDGSVQWRKGLYFQAWAIFIALSTRALISSYSVLAVSINTVYRSRYIGTLE